MNKVRILPLSGKPLEFELPGAKSVFTPTQLGFLVGPENRLLETAVLSFLAHTVRTGPENQYRHNAVSEIPASVFCFYGPSGTGKSHLLRGIWEAWKQGRRRHRGLFLNGTDFFREFANAIEIHTIDDFRRRFRNASLLVLDDLDELFRRPVILEEFLHTLESIERSGGLVLCSCKRSPSEWNGVDERLIARLIAGLSIRIAPPGPETRTLFLREVVGSFRLKLSESLLRRFAESQNTSLPVLYGLFCQLFFEAHAEGRRLGAEDFHPFFVESDPDKRKKLLDSILRHVAERYAVNPRELRGRSRRGALTLPRSIAVYLVRKLTESSFQEIGRYFGRRDHKTISYYDRQVREGFMKNPELRRNLMEIETAILTENAGR